jgi:hypothetical protein
MAKLYVAEFERGRNQYRQLANAPPVAEQTIAIGGASVVITNPFGSKTVEVRIKTDAICSIKFGDSTVTATVNNMRMSAEDTEYFSVQPNQYIAVISNT